MTGNDKSPIERAFELARTGRFHNVYEIVTRLRQERLGVKTITGRTLCRQLTGLIKEARQKIIAVHATKTGKTPK
jgi:hypothetical protein